MLSQRAAQLLLLAGLAAAFQRPALRSVAAPPRTALRASASDVTIDKDFRLALGTCGVALVLDQIPIIKWLPGLPLTLLGLLFLIQTFRLDFTFDDEAFELKSGEEDIGENVVVGGANRWAYDTFVNYETFPKGWDVPILVYFKETQTPESQWGVGPGEMANSADQCTNQISQRFSAPDSLVDLRPGAEAIANGAVKGQVHFFPAICNAKQITDEFARRGCGKL